MTKRTTIIKVDSDGAVNLEEFKDWLDINRVVYYNLKHKKDGKLIIKFYDKKRKLIKLYGQK